MKLKLREKKPTSPRSCKKAGDFLKKHPLARIIIVVDTHADEEGLFVHFEGEDSCVHSDTLNEVSFQTLTPAISSTTGKVLRDSVPVEIYQILDVSSKAVYQHRTLVLNMSCGETITRASSRNTLLAG